MLARLIAVQELVMVWYGNLWVFWAPLRQKPSFWPGGGSMISRLACWLLFISLLYVVYIGSTRVAITRIKKEIKTHTSTMAHLANCALSVGLSLRYRRYTTYSLALLYFHYIALYGYQFNHIISLLVLLQAPWLSFPFSFSFFLSWYCARSTWVRASTCLITWWLISYSTCDALEVEHNSKTLMRSFAAFSPTPCDAMPCHAMPYLPALNFSSSAGKGSWVQQSVILPLASNWKTRVVGFIIGRRRTGNNCYCNSKGEGGSKSVISKYGKKKEEEKKKKKKRKEKHTPHPTSVLEGGKRRDPWIRLVEAAVGWVCASTMLARVGGRGVKGVKKACLWGIDRVSWRALTMGFGWGWLVGW